MSQTREVGSQNADTSATDAGNALDIGYRADLIVEDMIIVENKSAEKTIPFYKKQLLTHLRLADRQLGLLINFGEELLKDGVFRVVNGLAEEP